MRRIIDSQQPSVALVIATFASVPCVHLALEMWRRNCVHAPVLVHDDGSPCSDELHALARRYGAEFFSNRTRRRRTVGDLPAYLHGLEWAATLQVDLLVKMSRRFIVLRNWVLELQALAWMTQYATYSQRCLHFDFGFRTECVAFHLPSWHDGRAFGDLQERVEANEPVFVEGRLHDLARRVHRSACDLNRQYEQVHPRSPEADAYGFARPNLFTARFRGS